ncbi:ADP-ribose pyrophosphatase [Mycobacterium mantenii]|uniref:NUDIX domain-containing protein n=1 Tax=Mycobacterium mantenii TaxID=560555 RepID=UPI0007FC5A3A|nr:NUDIX hydrolase [Mycobacterium mantenii]OBH53191.1 ADP-ribose pyrophosphatase [Mycobacterium mantenii]OBH79426.1 ADP-ribose pyrophosphatase [Mycobacterium mantenii]
MADHVFETASSETLYTGKIFALRSDRVRMPGGAVAVREVVEHYGAVAIAALDAENNLPLIYQYRHAFGRRLWELPAGLLDIAGEPPQQTAARELQEEAGLRAETWQVLADLNSAPGFSDESVRIYLATGLSEVDRPEAHHEEADMTMRWFPVADAARMVFSGEVVNSIAIAGILAAHAVTEGFARPRPADSPWIDRPTAFAARKGGRAAQ